MGGDLRLDERRELRSQALLLLGQHEPSRRGRHRRCPLSRAGAVLSLRSTSAAMALTLLKLLSTRSPSSTVIPNSDSTKSTSCIAASELTNPEAKMFSS